MDRGAQLICRAYHVKCQAGWITSWNQGCQQKYQQPQICRQYHSNGRKWRGTKEPLDEGKRGEQKAGLKLNIQKTKIIESSPTTSWQVGGGIVEAVADFIFLESKITVDIDYNHEMKIHSLLGRKAITNLDSVFKNQRHHFANKGRYNQSYGFSSSHVQIWVLDHKED